MSDLHPLEDKPLEELQRPVRVLREKSRALENNDKSDKALFKPTRRAKHAVPAKKPTDLKSTVILEEKDDEEENEEVEKEIEDVQEVENDEEEEDEQDVKLPPATPKLRDQLTDRSVPSRQRKHRVWLSGM
jgi:hypothetical protein